MTVIVAGASISAVGVLDALTTTSSFRPVGFSVIVGTVAPPLGTVTLLVTWPNPTRLTVSSYVPGATLLKLNSPCGPVVVDERARESARSTVAPGTTPPVSSATVPETVACAYSGAASPSRTATITSRRFIKPPQQFGSHNCSTTGTLTFASRAIAARKQADASVPARQRRQPAKA